jgi:uncharacterized protein (TIGR02466 family)
MYNIHGIFPTPVLQTNINRQFSKEEMDVVYEHQNLTYSNIGNKTSLHTKVLTELLPSIKADVDNALKYYLDNIMSPKSDVELYVTQSWLNYSNTGNFHHKHTHANSILSGTLYLDVDESSDKIVFLKENYEFIDIERNWNYYNSESWWFSVKTGDIFIFPSHLPHMVETVVSDKTRISIAFNTFVKGTIGSEKSLTFLSL